MRDHDELGEILVDAEGVTLYMFDDDVQGKRESACRDGCLEEWPPLTVDEEPAAGDGVTAEIDTVERADGSTQVRANGWPLYYYHDDTEPGDDEGQGKHDVWWVLDPAGEPIRDGAETRSDGADSTDDESTDGT